MDYVSKSNRVTGCLFCRLKRKGDDRDRLILRRHKNAYLLLNAYPYNSGHLMVAVTRHVGKIAKLTAPERRDLWDLVALGETIVERVYHPDGFNCGINLGRAAGAGVDGHVHMHLVPRWSGDANFMTTVGDSKVLPEDLLVTYDRLYEAIARLKARR